MLSDNDQKRKELPYLKTSRDIGQKDAYIGNELHLQNHTLTFIH